MLSNFGCMCPLPCAFQRSLCQLASLQGRSNEYKLPDNMPKEERGNWEKMVSPKELVAYFQIVVCYPPHSKLGKMFTGWQLKKLAWSFAHLPGLQEENEH